MKHLRYLLLALVFSLSPPSLEAQEAEATITFLGHGVITSISHTCPAAQSGQVVGYVGDTISCTLAALDPDGNPTPAIFTVLVDSIAKLDAWIVADTLHVTWLAPGVSTAVVTATEQMNIALFRYEQPGQPLVWAYQSPTWPDTLFVGEDAQLCAYFGEVSRPTAVSSSLNGVPCPDLGPNSPLPRIPVVWTISDTPSSSSSIHLNQWRFLH